MTNLGPRRLAKILSNLPEPCRQELTRLQQDGWRCSFYLGTRNQKLMLCLAAGKGAVCHIVFHHEIEPLVAELKRQIAGAATQAADGQGG